MPMHRDDNKRIAEQRSQDDDGEDQRLDDEHGGVRRGGRGGRHGRVVDGRGGAAPRRL